MDKQVQRMSTCEHGWRGPVALHFNGQCAPDDASETELYEKAVCSKCGAEKWILTRHEPANTAEANRRRPYFHMPFPFPPMEVRQLSRDDLPRTYGEYGSIPGDGGYHSTSEYVLLFVVVSLTLITVMILLS